MPYYTGDYYQGGDNYQRGDFLGIGKALKKLNPLKIVGGLLAATPIGGVVKTLIPGMGRPAGGGGMNIIPSHGVPEPGITGVVHRAVSGGSSGLGYYNKRGEFVEGRRPRMNPLNVRALSRAMRRAKGFEKHAKRVGSYFSPGKTYRLKGRRKKAAS